MAQKYEVLRDVAQSLVFRKSVPPGESGYIDCDITAHGFVRSVRIRFAAGENGTLHIRPVIILPGNILLDLFKYAQGGDTYVSGDDETIVSDVKMEVENNTIARVYYDNLGEEGTTDSVVNVDIEVEYYTIIEPVNIIGPQG